MRTRETNHPIRRHQKENMVVETRWDCCPQHVGILAGPGPGEGYGADEVNRWRQAEDRGKGLGSSEKAEMSEGIPICNPGYAVSSVSAGLISSQGFLPLQTYWSLPVTT